MNKILKIFKEEKIVKPNSTWKSVQFFRPKESKECPDGYSGRVGIYEVLSVTETIKELIVKRATSDQIQDQAKKEGMRTMIEDGFVKAVRGQTSIEEILRVISE
jgi:type II secretory ATPase GspE/PulE/Tfp pilus assembly ATPase PilB-like protein